MRTTTGCRRLSCVLVAPSQPARSDGGNRTAGGSALFQMHWTLPSGNEATCAASSRLAVTLPDEFVPLTMPNTIGAGRDRAVRGWRRGPVPARSDAEERNLDFAKNLVNDNEFAGATFSPDGPTLFVNIQTPGATCAIWGPWERGAL
jgi:Bacterial protein of unknown function (DUF839)